MNSGSDWSPGLEDRATGRTGVVDIDWIREVASARPAVGSKGLGEGQGNRGGSLGRERGGVCRR